MLPSTSTPSFSLPSCLLLTFHRLSPLVFFSNAPATTAIYTLSLHDALPISRAARSTSSQAAPARAASIPRARGIRSEEHTSELQSHHELVCRLLLEKKKRRLHRRSLHGRHPSRRVCQESREPDREREAPTCG